MHALKQLTEQGQSIWLDYIRRNLITTGELKRLVEEDGVTGITSNPTIFEKAIAGSTDYDERFRAMLAQDPHMTAGKLYEPLAIEDIQMAADVLRPVYDATAGDDGYVSLEVSPHLARDTEATINEAKRLRAAVARPNLMIKVPATPEGIPAIEQLIADGLNINITLMFSMAHYEAVARAYIRGLERCVDPSAVASVASFFVSRVDTAVDRALEAIGTPDAMGLRGKIAIANSKVVYRRFEEIFHGEGFVALRQRGARVQRPLWASTGTKNPAYSDVLYVESLIGPETVNTLPPETLNAFRDHGRVAGATVKQADDAEVDLRRLADLGIDLAAVTEKLQLDGVASFAASFDQLMAALDKKRKALLSEQGDRFELHLGGYQRRVDRRLKSWEESRLGARIWDRDHTVWFRENRPELTDRLGWLELPQTMEKELAGWRAFADKAKADGIRHIVVLGMGGSSLAPEVFQGTFGNAPGYPELQVLDSTHPDAVAAVEERIDLARTLFVVSSKSGTTIETNSFFFYFWDKLKQLKSEPGANFVAITDPGTPLQQLAAARNFRGRFLAPEDVGGRYSALTAFALVPAALIGVDVAAVIARGRSMAEICGASVPARQNPALQLGAALAELTLVKRDKVTFLCSPSVNALPTWIEQLIAESTGKERKGIVPVVTENLASPETYGADRCFVYLRFAGDENHDLDRRVAALQANGHPVLRIEIADKADLGREYFRWEFAIAAAGSALGIHPFDQPDVQLAKDLAKKAMQDSARTGARVKDEILVQDRERLRAALFSWFQKKKPRDYVAVQAFLAPSADNRNEFRALGSALEARLGAATTLGFGPRYLHSTGQLHKGGPNTALVLQIVDAPLQNKRVPETDYSFEALIKAQSQGDYAALKQRRRRIVRVNVGSDAVAGLRALAEIIRS